MDSLERDIQSSENSSEVVNLNEKKGSLWLILLNIFLSIVTLCLIAYIAQKEGYIDIQKIFNKEEDYDYSRFGTTIDGGINYGYRPEYPRIPIEATTSTFSGKYVSATIPDYWNIVEYHDGKGSDMLVDGVEYTGLTGIEISEGTEVIMSIEAVSGVGFEGCPELPRFNDSYSDYEDEQSEINEVVGDNMIIIDYTNTDYSDINFLGKDFRRVNTSLYYDTIEDDEYFEPQCEKQFIFLNGITFSDSNGYEGTTYTYDISSTASVDSLYLLDDVLESMAITD